MTSALGCSLNLEIQKSLDLDKRYFLRAFPDALPAAGLLFHIFLPRHADRGTLGPDVVKAGRDLVQVVDLQRDL